MDASNASNGLALKPEVSVVLPCYNGSAWLSRSVESVRCQKGATWELVVVDDGSDRDPGPILNGFGDRRIRYMRRDHAGKGAALNDGISMCRADLISFIDQDDIMLPDRLRCQVDVFHRQPQADAVYSDYERRDDTGRFIDRFISRQVSPQEGLQWMAAGRGPLTMQTLMLKKTAWARVGKFSEIPEMSGLDDLEFFVKFFLSKPVMVYAPGVVQCWVRHEQNFSASAAFQEARLHGLKRLSELAVEHPLLRPEMKHFAFHAHYMRGIHFLETQRPKRAVIEFRKAAVFRPSCLNNYYLLLKSLVAQTVARGPKPAKPGQPIS